MEPQRINVEAIAIARAERKRRMRSRAKVAITAQFLGAYSDADLARDLAHYVIGHAGASEDARKVAHEIINRKAAARRPITVEDKP